MKKTLLDLSKQVDEPTADFYQTISKVAASLGIPFFVVGATARDMILHYAFGYESKRGTEDIDLGIQVSSWEQYEKLKQGLLKTGLFTPGRGPHRYIFSTGLPVDIVPFGPISNANGDITWPPDHSVKMSVLGFQEAYDHAQRVQVRENPELIIPFATPIGLTVMKLFSWADGLVERKQKDAYDLAFIMNVYSDIVGIEVISEKHSDLLEAEDFNFVHSGGRILGRDMAQILKPETKIKILEILEHQTRDQDRFPLIEDMMKSPSIFTNPFEEYLKILTELKRGVSEGSL